jgi:ABC-type phosphate transport system permease subunit
VTFRNQTLSKRALSLVLFICLLPSATTALIFQLAFYQNSTNAETSIHYQHLIANQSWIEDYGEVKAFIGSDCVSLLTVFL